MSNANNHYYVYLHTTPNNKYYVGITGTSPSLRWKNGKGYRNNEHFCRAIELYGWENIKHEILFDSLTLEEAELKEQEMIHKYNSDNPAFGYNKTSGGETCKVYNEEAKANISNALKKMYEEHPERKPAKEKNGMYGRSGEKNPNYGCHHSDETKLKISSAKTGKKMSPDARRNISQGHTGRYKHPVICIETATIYGGPTDAKNKLGINDSSIISACKNPNRTAGGFHWQYYVKGDNNGNQE